MNIFFISALPEWPSISFIATFLSRSGHDVHIGFATGIPGGSNWAQETTKRLLEADWIVVPISTEANGDMWVQRQILDALDLAKPILPLLIDDSAIPSFLRHIRYIDVRNDVSEGKLSVQVKSVVGFLNTQKYPEYESEDKPSSGEIAIQREKISAADSHIRIFIAYSRQQRPLASEISTLLFKHGKPNFYDAKIKAGASWRQTIQKALDDATHVVVIWTPEAAESDEVEREVSYALAERKVIVPILSKEIPKLPYHLHGLHYIVLNDDLTAIESDLLKAIARFSGDEDLWK